ncbi:MAG TPA: GNAT family N-acetyltransferase [Pseudogracilibacillus sp.]|nr:GNAT family N-acetyltransferase [Pseudogracilibacillus sp.]
MEPLRLKVLEKADIAFLHRLSNEPAVMNYWFEEAYYTLETIEEDIDKYKTNPSLRRFIIQKDNQPLGLVALYDIDPIHRKAEFAIMLDPAKQGNGFALPATETAVNYAFRTLNLHKLYLIVDEENERAIHVYEKAGFKQEAVLEKEYFIEGSYHNVVYMSILEEDYWKS